MRSAWHFFVQHSLGFIFGFLLTAVGVLVGVGAYILTMVCLAGAGFSAIVWCLNSSHVSEWETREARPVALVGCLLILAIFISAMYGTWYLREQAILQDIHGALLPDTLVTPATPCDEMMPHYRNAVLFVFGSAASIVTSFPHTVLQIKGKKRLLVDKDPSGGGISLSVDIFDQDNKLVATIDHNEFSINQSNYSLRQRPNRSSLIVYDEYKNEVLNVHYLNSGAIKLLGRLHYPEATVSFTERGVLVGAQNFSNICIGNFRTDFSVN